MSAASLAHGAFGSGIPGSASVVSRRSAAHSVDARSAKERTSANRIGDDANALRQRAEIRQPDQQIGDRAAGERVSLRRACLR